MDSQVSLFAPLLVTTVLHLTTTVHHRAVEHYQFVLSHDNGFVVDYKFSRVVQRVQTTRKTGVATMDPISVLKLSLAPGKAVEQGHAIALPLSVDAFCYAIQFLF